MLELSPLGVCEAAIARRARSLTDALAALWAAKSSGIPLVYEIRAFWEDAAVGNGTGREGSLRYWLTKQLETHAVKSADAVAVMESIVRISDRKLGSVNTNVSRDEVLKELVRCGYVKSADLADRFSEPSTLNPELDPDIVGPGAIFSSSEFASDDEFRKTASVMKLVVNGFAGAGTITMGGYDYHTGERATGELRDLRAGRCIGACLEYAARRGVPLMVYVFSDGSVASNGRIDDSADGRGKGEWTGDNGTTAASFFLVYNPAGRPVAIRHQLGYMRPDASVETASSPAANNVNLLVETVVWNYLALHGEQGRFESLFPAHGLGPVALRDSLTGLAPIVNGTIS